MEFNNPLITRSAAAHTGNLPAKWGLLEISNDDVVTSALNSGKDGTVIVRVYEAAGKPSQGVRASWRGRISQVRILLKIPGRALKRSATASRSI